MSTPALRKLELLLARVQQRRAEPRGPARAAQPAVPAAQAPRSPFSEPPDTGRLPKVDAPTAPAKKFAEPSKPGPVMSPFQARADLPESEELVLDDLDGGAPTIQPHAADMPVYVKVPALDQLPRLSPPSPVPEAASERELPAELALSSEPELLPAPEAEPPSEPKLSLALQPLPSFERSSEQTPVQARALRFEPAPEQANEGDFDRLPEPVSGPTAHIVPATLVAASPVAVATAARLIKPKSFGDLLELTLALRPPK